MAAELNRLPRLVYPLRVVGMGLGAAVAMVVLHERQAAPAVWAVVFCGGFVWPHLAYWLARRSGHPQRAEVRNLLVDSAIAGAFVPLMQFNLLPSVLLVTLTTMDKISTGVRLLWLRSLPGMLAAAALAAWWMGAPMVVESSMQVVVACIPMLVIHTLAVNVSSYRLIRKVSQQNRMLDELRRIDPLTGLYGRTHWEQQASEVLRRHGATGEPACLMMLDIDGFKQINDGRGHTVGDDVIRAMGQIVRACVRASDCAGRYGGDEFAVLLRGTDMAQAREIAQRIRAETEAHRFREHEELRFTSSIGIAAVQRHYATPRDWIAAADTALYEAKRAGRNRVEVRPPSRRAPLASS
ncbi:sensor domain-containing diguanylate cyclase [Pseudorhodoferax sp. Leaf274]|uniref:sensor domain-containing diguanylate cyclase n=1 Tax=Pseudorhodoferax sp. Leaf274 TaxID=1736318 RepID=UPI000702B404|nr:sensor domain-containing diguanylate cyclase [Pseudorhodoferax sp. Leaf274]KQP37495.1 diguanylate cyclase [Pseudorhodoferax sp. Leaf274]